MPTIKQITAHLETIAPLNYQEGYDNACLITGDPSWEVTNVLCSLDCTEAIIEEAMQRGCNLVVAHHPIVFKGLKRLNGRNYVERTIIKAIKNVFMLILLYWLVYFTVMPNGAKMSFPSIRTWAKSFTKPDFSGSI